jgi:hypothetical protein
MICSQGSVFARYDRAEHHQEEKTSGVTEIHEKS